ncbi:MAG: VIT1/CCC1 transporter family protein [Candidatus Spechtbacterales bacterium]
MISWLYKKIGEFLKDAVYAANDGVITTFAVVAGVVGASLDPIVILVLGFANLFADGISMASGNYLGTKSEKGLYSKERERNRRLLREDKEKYKKRISAFLESKGYADSDLRGLAELITHNEKFALDFMMHEEIGLVEQEEARPLKGAMVTLAAFMLAGLVPLVPYIFFTASANAFLYASIFTAIALFGIGAARSIFTEKSWFSSGLEMFLVGGLAAVVAYGIGFGVSRII